MTIQEIETQLKAAKAALDDAGVDDDTKLDLEILILQLRKQMIIAGFDPLKELSSVTVADLSTLRDLVAQVDTVIKDEKQRVKIVQKIVSTAKIGLKAAGLPIPSEGSGWLERTAWPESAIDR